jgi:hypothetical protein
VKDQLARLCNLLDEEIERQENLLAICRAQQQALLAQDLDSMQARTAAMEAVARESAQAHVLRLEALRPLRESVEMAGDGFCLSDLIAVAPAGCRDRLREIQARLRGVVAENRNLIRSNARLLRTSMRLTEEVLNAFQNCAETLTRGYTEQGAGASGTGRVPAMIDQRG